MSNQQPFNEQTPPPMPPHPWGPEDQPAVAANMQYRHARDKAQYVRQQKGHSILLHIFLIGPFTLWIPMVYISVSPNHYWHA